MIRQLEKKIHVNAVNLETLILPRKLQFELENIGYLQKYLLIWKLNNVLT